MSYDICLALFDMRKGPYVAFQRGISDEVAKHLALKTMIASGSLNEWDGEKESEAIITVNEHDVVTFFRIFPILNLTGQGDKTLPAAIVFVTNKNNQIKIYQDAPKLSVIGKKFSTELMNFVKANNRLSEADIAQIINQQLPKSTLDSLATETVDVVAEISKEEQKSSVGSVQVWKDFVDSDIDKVVHQLITGNNLVFILKNKDLSPLQVATCKIFTPHLKPVISYWNASYDKQYTIQCGSTDLAKTVPSDVTIFDQVANKIRGGTSSQYCLNLFNVVAQQSTDKAVEYIRNTIDTLLSDIGTLLAQITDLFDIGPTGDAYILIINQFKTNRTTDELRVIEAIMNKTNYELLDTIKQRFLLGQSRLQIIQDAVIDHLGPAGKIIIKKVIKKLNIENNEIKSADLPFFIKTVFDVLKPMEILSEKEINDLRNSIKSETDDYRSLLDQTSIFS
jgi:hypothetical protein